VPLRFFIILLLGTPLYAATPLVLTDTQQTYPLASHIELLPDPQAQLTIEEASDPSFADRYISSPIGAGIPLAWARFTLQNDALQNDRWIVLMEIQGYELFELYVPDPAAPGRWVVKRGSDGLPFSEWDVKHRYPALRLSLEPGQTGTFYLRLHNVGDEPLILFLSLWSEAAFSARDHDEQVLLGIYYGIIAVMVFYNLFLYFSLRDRAYLYYVISMSFACIWFANFNGIGKEYVWTEIGSPWGFWRIHPLTACLFWLWQLVFVRSFLHTRAHTPRIDRLLWALIGVNALAVAAALMGQHQYFIPYIFFFLNLEWFLVLVTAIVIWRRGFRPARYFLIAWGTHIAGVFLLFLVVYGWVARSFISWNALQVGHALEAILLSLALADRINILREEKEQEEESSRQAQLRAQTAELQAQIAEQELQTARTLQMGLMPTTPPTLAGFELAGRCLPASEVGGDFFQYFEQDGKLSLCMADVTGHAMEAAVPVMMFSGVLETEMQYGHSVERLLTQLNQLLHRKLDRRTFICFAIGEVHLQSRLLRLSNVGCPPLYHYRQATGRVVELEGGGYPLGVQPEGVYAATEIALGPGDRIVFCSDGLVEAANVQEEIFGFDQVAESIRQGCADDLSAAALIDRLIGAVQDFSGDVSQADDMTCVVLKVNTQG